MAQLRKKGRRSGRSGRSSPRRRPFAPDRRRAILIVAIPALILIGMLVWHKWAETTTATGGDLCRTNHPVDAHTILILDRTDAITAENKRYLERLVGRLQRRLEPFEKFSIFAIESAGTGVPRKYISLCSPGTAENVSGINRTPGEVQKQFDEKFRGPIRELIGSLGRETTAEKSPIMETLQFVIATKDFGAEVPSRRIVLFSDMLQHSRYSHYRNSIEYRDFMESSLFEGFQIPLRGLTVEIHYLPRANAARIQGPRHLQFWRDYLEDAGAKVEINPVEG